MRFTALRPVRRRHAAALAAVLACCLAATAGRAQLLAAPAEVVAGPAGDVAFEVRLVAGAEPMYLLAEQILGDNAPGITSDYLPVPIEAGGELVLPVSSRLIDPAREGRLDLEYTVSVGGLPPPAGAGTPAVLTASVRLLPSGSVPAADDTWGAIKARYR